MFRRRCVRPREKRLSQIVNTAGTGNLPRILLADDHSVLLERVAKFLQPTFEVVGMARNGLEMIDAAVRLKPDIIVTDISMPDLDGIEAAHRLREMGHSVIIVFLTIHESSEFVDACLAEGAMGYVVKSHVKRDLIPAINAALSGRRFVSPASHT